MLLGRQGDNSQFVAKFVGIRVTNISYKSFPQIASKIFAIQCSFTNHLKHKIVNKNKATYRTPLANPLQL